MKKNCKDNQILNPVTKRCVKIKGDVSSKLIEKHKNGEIKLDPLDISKLEKSGIILKKINEYYSLGHDSAIKEDYKKTNPVALKDKDLSKNVIHLKKHINHLISNKLLERRQKKNNETLKKYCVVRDGSILHKPAVYMSAKISIPVETIQFGTVFYPYMLDHNFKYINKVVQGVNITYNNYIEDIAKIQPSDYLLNLESQIDWKWLKEMNQYVKTLSKADIYNLKGYTHYGDVIVNSYLRKTLKKDQFIKDLKSAKWSSFYYPLFFSAMELFNETSEYLLEYVVKPEYLSEVKILLSKKTYVESYNYFINIMSTFHYENFWINVITKYSNNLLRIFNNAPVTNKNMIVYRGIKEDYVMNGKNNNVYKTNCFVSTSFDLKIAMSFTGSTCCLQRITLLKGARILLIAGISSYAHEMEVLLNPNTVFYISGKDKKFYRNIYDLCPYSSFNEIKVTDMIVLKT